MSVSPFQRVDIGPYQGAVFDEYHAPALLKQLGNIATLLQDGNRKVLADREDKVIHISLRHEDALLPIAVKSFGARSSARDKVDKARGSRAQRAWVAARAMVEYDVPTPQPIAYLEQWNGSRLTESYYLTVFDETLVSFREELIRIYRHEPNSSSLINLLQPVAEAVRLMHDAGIQHRDMGNQNILLHYDGHAHWSNAQFIDLNRALVKDTGLALKDRAFDVSRVFLPSDFLRIFVEMYFEGPPPAEFDKWHQRYRSAYDRHARSRKLRHPIRSRQRERDVDEDVTYPPMQDLWLWDEKSAQAISTMKSKDRHRFIPISTHRDTARAVVKAARPVWKLYKELLASCYQERVPMENRVGIAIEPKPDTAERELELLHSLGKIPVIARFYHHKGPNQWKLAANVLRKLSDEGYSVSAAMIQDRRAVMDPQAWVDFVDEALEPVVDSLEWVEVGHAINRVKWGIWSYKEYVRLLAALGKYATQHPYVKFMGPAVIDFEYHHLITTLDAMPRNFYFDALSHHLYVDRRGAPENKQGRFSALEKFALARAIARNAIPCSDKLIVSEVNWPLQNTGIYSPTASPYLYPGQTVPGHVSENEYANYMIRYLAQAACSGMVDRVYWWRLVAHGFGLVDDKDPADWRLRPAFGALKHFIALLGDSTFVKKLPSPDGTHALVFERASGEKVILAYAHQGQQRMALPYQYSKPVTMLGLELPHTEPILELSGEPVYLLNVE